MAHTIMQLHNENCLRIWKSEFKWKIFIIIYKLLHTVHCTHSIRYIIHSILETSAPLFPNVIKWNIEQMIFNNWTNIHNLFINDIACLQAFKIKEKKKNPQQDLNHKSQSPDHKSYYSWNPDKLSMLDFWQTGIGCSVERNRDEKKPSTQQWTPKGCHMRYIYIHFGHQRVWWKIAI